jgi:hypothetical protein
MLIRLGSVLLASYISIISAINVSYTTEKEITLDGQMAILYYATGNVKIGEITIRGKEKSRPFVCVHLDYSSMKLNPSIKSSTVPKILWFRVGLAKTKEGGRDVVKWSDYYVVDEILSKGETKTFNDIDIVIPIDGLDDLKGHWIIIRIETQRGGSRACVYAHSPRDIFEQEDQ